MSTIKLGDRVRFVNENLEGVVTNINGATAGVTIEDDFEIPVPVSQIVKITGPQNHHPEETNKPPVNNIAPVNRGIYIAFDRLNETLLDLKLYNSNAEEVAFAFYEQDRREEFKLKKTGNIELNDLVDLGRYDLEKFSQWPQLHFQILQINKRTKKLSLPINRTITFNAKEFHGAFKNTFFLNRQAYLFKIDEDILPLNDLKKLQEKDFTEKPGKNTFHNQRPESVIDLHIEKLVADITSLNPTEMVATQMEAFTKNLEMAHVNKMKSIIFIHGVGNHFLKNKIRNYLGLQKKWVSSYNDADMLRYGGGATEVFLN